jgi:S-adenosylmethionine/arginine decarboxylase-like enzyme
MKKLGEQIFVVTVPLIGEIKSNDCNKIVDKIIHCIRMSPVHKPTKYKYPANGKGGVGFTFIQPITESFIALDSWPQHNGAYLIICSCKEVKIKKVINCVKKFNLTVGKPIITKSRINHAAIL